MVDLRKVDPSEVSMEAGACTKIVHDYIQSMLTVVMSHDIAPNLLAHVLLAGGLKFAHQFMRSDELEQLDKFIVDCRALVSGHGVEEVDDHLSHCPVCNGPAEMEEDEFGAMVRCTDCGLNTGGEFGSKLSEDDLVKLWNRRSNAIPIVIHDGGIDDAD